MPPVPTTLRLIALLVAIFLGLVASELAIAPFPNGMPWWAPWLATNVELLMQGRIWTVVTHFFVHSTADWGHVLYNSITLFFFGGALERQFGSREMLRLYFAGAAAAALFILCSSAVRTALGEFDPVVLGASGAIAALISGWAIRNRNQKIYLFFVIPVPALAALGLMIVIDLIRAQGGGLSLAGHLGGYLYGALWATGNTPRRLWLRVKLWNVKRKLRVVRGGDLH